MTQIDGYVVFWLAYQPALKLFYPGSEMFESDKMSEALKFANELRKDNLNQFIVMASQNNNSVGKPGVDAVINGKLPSGEKYEWVMRRPPVNLGGTDEKFVENE